MQQSVVSTANADKHPRVSAASVSAQIVVIVRATEGQATVLTDDVDAWSQRLLSLASNDERAKPFQPLVGGYYTGASGLGGAKPSPGSLTTEPRAALPTAP